MIFWILTSFQFSYKGVVKGEKLILLLIPDLAIKIAKLHQQSSYFTHPYSLVLFSSKYLILGFNPCHYPPKSAPNPKNYHSFEKTLLQKLAKWISENR